MAKQRDTLASLRKKITFLENDNAYLKEQLTAKNKELAASFNDKSILVSTIKSLTGSTPSA